MTTATTREILNQPRAWASTLQTLDAQLDDLRRFREGTSQAPIVFTGCGSPHYMALSLATVFRQMTQAPAVAIPASNIWLFTDSHLRGDERLMVCVSRSGETSEVIQAARTFQQRTGGQVIAITCNEDTSLAKVASHTVILTEAQEISLAQTQSFTSMLIAVLVLIQQGISDGLRKLPDMCQTLLDMHQDLGRQLGRDESLERFFFLGGGALYGMANEAMLKLKEMSLTYSEAFHTLEFRHGPMAMVNAQSLVVGLVSAAAHRQEAGVLQDMRRMGARVLALTPVALPTDAYTHQILLPDALSDAERLPLYLPILQLMAEAKAVSKGLDPDTPANLHAFVTLDDVD